MVYVKRGEGVEDIRRQEGDTAHNIGVKTDTHEGRGGTSVLGTWGTNGSDHGAWGGDTETINIPSWPRISTLKFIILLSFCALV